MTFYNNNLQYSVAFDLRENRFIATDKTDETRVAYGITIEEAVQALKKFA